MGINKSYSELEDMVINEFLLEYAREAWTEEGYEGGVAETLKKVILSMHNGGEDVNKIAQYADLSVEEVKSIVRSSQ